MPRTRCAASADPAPGPPRRHLVGPAEDVGVVEVDLPDPAQAATATPERSARNIGAELVEPDRQLAVGCAARRRRSARGAGSSPAAARGPLPPTRHRREHVVGELRPVPGPLEQGPLAEHGGVDRRGSRRRRAISRANCSSSSRITAPAGSHSGRPAPTRGSVRRRPGRGRGRDGRADRVRRVGRLTSGAPSGGSRSSGQGRTKPRRPARGWLGAAGSPFSAGGNPAWRSTKLWTCLDGSAGTTRGAAGFSSPAGCRYRRLPFVWVM